MIAAIYYFTHEYSRAIHTSIYSRRPPAENGFYRGARQVGKTSLALSLLEGGSESHPAYLNWDSPKVHQPLLRGELPARQSLIILDEIHKYSRWRNLVKGLFDVNKSHLTFLVTGSARLAYSVQGVETA